MTRQCPTCGAEQKPTATFCDQCGEELKAEPSATAVGEMNLARGPSVTVAPAEPAPAAAAPTWESAGPTPAGAEIVVEVETNRRHVLRHASLLRFRVTNNMRQSCGIAIQMRLYGQGRYVDQDEEEIEQCCQFEQRGDQYIFSFPFQALTPGQIRVNQLRILIIRTDQPESALVYELPDQSLFVDVSDPAMTRDAPGVEISGGIHIDFSKLQEMYGSDIKSLLNIQQPTETGQAAVAWQPIRLRVLGEQVLPRKETMPRDLRLALPGGVFLELVRIPAGEFTMGSPERQGRDDERPVRRVTISRDFYLSKFLVTQEQYQAVMGSNPSRFPLSPQHPVDSVSWDDARDFCRRLRAQLTFSADALGSTHLTLDDVSLPTEAEWEYACRAGTTTLWSFGDDRQEMVHYGWCDKNSQRQSQLVGQLKPNAWGLYDMHGDLSEWCGDYFAPTYEGAAEHDPCGPAIGERRVLRGGSWSSYAKDCRSARRHTAPQNERTPNYGFRVAVRVSVNKGS